MLANLLTQNFHITQLILGLYNILMPTILLNEDAEMVEKV